MFFSSVKDAILECTDIEAHKQSRLARQTALSPNSNSAMRQAGVTREPEFPLAGGTCQASFDVRFF